MYETWPILGDTRRVLDDEFVFMKLHLESMKPSLYAYSRGSEALKFRFKAN
jgi:hypothetical protein